MSAEIRRIVEEMRSERSRYKSHDLGFVDSVSASRVDEWADELEALLPARQETPPHEEGSRYFVNVVGFKDGTAYVRVDPAGRAWIHTHAGTVTRYTASNLEVCLEKVSRGIWRELPAAQESA